MSELYWITRFDGFLIAIIIPMVILLAVSLGLFIASCDIYDKDRQKQIRKRAIICGSIGFLLLIMQAFIPTTNQALVIYGVGGTIDYIKSNETAKKLPDKVIIALDRYLESINEKEEKK
jgi:hypothetical protein